MTISTLTARNDVELSSAMLHASFENARESDLGAGLAARLARTRALLDEAISVFDESAATATRDLRPAAAERAMADARRQASEAITKISQPMIDELEERATNFRARLTPVPVDMRDKVVLAVELRSRLRLRDPLDVSAIYLESCRVRDALSIYAIESAPAWDRLIDAATLEAGRRIVSQLDHPDVVASLETTEQVLSALHAAIRACKRHCGLVDSPAALARDA